MELELLLGALIKNSVLGAGSLNVNVTAVSEEA